MRPLLILYATHEGQTRKIAEHVAATVRARGDAADVVDAARVPAGFELSRYAAVFLAASLHFGKYEREMLAFVKTNRSALERLPTAFLSVSLVEAGVEDRTASFEHRGKAAVQVKATVDAFCHETGLHPSRVWPVAGALAYSKYGMLERLAMKMIARSQGADTDTAHDHEYTDWTALDRFVGAMAEEMERGEAQRLGVDSGATAAAHRRADTA